MTRLFVLVLFLPLVALSQKIGKNKRAVIAAVEHHKENLIRISDSIWGFAEIAFQESKSSEVLASYAEKNGMKVTRGVAEIPTAFTATYGSGKPVISILGEFDALPGLSQNIQPIKNAMTQGAPGHGCGHNLFGAASLGAAIAIKEQIEKGSFTGTVKFLGTPAEEKYFAKVWMVKAGLWSDVDVNLSWHPGAFTAADVQSSLSLIDFIVEFYGQAAHASLDPWNGRSASDALELYTTGINYYREHIRPTSRIHYHIQDGGQVVNVVPDYSKIWVRVRDPKRDVMFPTYEQVKKIAEGAAIMANVDYKISLVSGIYEMLVNRSGGEIMQNNLELLGPISYNEEETTFGMGIQRAIGKPEIGMDSSINPLLETEPLPGGASTDVADVSWNVPNINLSVTTAPRDTPWHSWAVVACGGMSIGHKGMVYASKALAMTMIDLFENPKMVKKVQEEFKWRKGDTEYQAMIDGPPPIGADFGVRACAYCSN